MTTLNFGGTIPRAAGAPPAYKIEANPYPVDLPCETAAVPDKTFPGHRPSLEFPHPLQATPAEWVKALRKQRGKELGTSEKCTVRAFITPRSHGAIRLLTRDAGSRVTARKSDTVARKRSRSNSDLGTRYLAYTPH